jgi:hypothetical protein
VEELERYRAAWDGVAWSYWQIIWLLAEKANSQGMAAVTGYHGLFDAVDSGDC